MPSSPGDGMSNAVPPRLNLCGCACWLAAVTIVVGIVLALFMVMRAIGE